MMYGFIYNPSGKLTENGNRWVWVTLGSRYGWWVRSELNLVSRVEMQWWVSLSRAHWAHWVSVNLCEQGLVEVVGEPTLHLPTAPCLALTRGPRTESCSFRHCHHHLHISPLQQDLKLFPKGGRFYTARVIKTHLTLNSLRIELKHWKTSATKCMFQHGGGGQIAVQAMPL